MSEKEHNEYQYLNLLRRILENGKEVENRTGINTIRLIGESMRFDLSDGRFPLITTKKMYWRGILDEFLFFMSGETDITKGLPSRSQHWWSSWVDENNSIGPIYPKQYRKFQAVHNGSIVELDQLKFLLQEIQENPNSRRLLLTSYNPAEVVAARKECSALLFPCHGLTTQFWVDDGRLSLCTYQRSMDTFIGGAVNIAHYGLVLSTIAKHCGLRPGVIQYFVGDAHVYTNHIKQVKTQLERKPLKWPRLHIVDNFDIFNMSREDFYVGEYFYHRKIKAPIAV